MERYWQKDNWRWDLIVRTASSLARRRSDDNVGQSRRPRLDSWTNESSFIYHTIPKPFIWICPKPLAKPSFLAARAREPKPPVTNWEGYHIPIKRLVVAYHCNPNLANLNSYRKLTTRTGLKPSAIII
jgi:hypothetical protein